MLKFLIENISSKGKIKVFVADKKKLSESNCRYFCENYHYKSASSIIIMRKALIDSMKEK